MTGWRWRAGRAVHHRLPAAGGSSRSYQPPTGAPIPASDARAATAPPPIDPQPAAANPILTASDLGTDIEFVADPFLYLDDDWHLFVEVYRPAVDPPAAIAHLQSSDRGRSWTYSGVVLDPGVHLAFPFVFAWDGERYMLPDPWSERPGVPADFTLYRASDFPTAWEPVATPISPEQELHDCVLLRHEGRWWAFAGEGGELYAFYADTLETDDWTPHADNPVVTNRPEAVRPAGRPIAREDGFVLLFQDCARRYGERIWAYEITELSPSTYRDERVGSGPVVGPAGGIGWNSGRMHHVDAWLFEDRWLCAVDGNVGLGKPLFGDHWAIGLYEQRLA